MEMSRLKREYESIVLGCLLGAGALVAGVVYVIAIVIRKIV
jgi:hypothetical protein